MLSQCLVSTVAYVVVNNTAKTYAAVYDAGIPTAWRDPAAAQILSQLKSSLIGRRLSLISTAVPLVQSPLDGPNIGADDSSNRKPETTLRIALGSVVATAPKA